MVILTEGISPKVALNRRYEQYEGLNVLPDTNNFHTTL